MDVGREGKEEIEDNCPKDTRLDLGDGEDIHPRGEKSA